MNYAHLFSFSGANKAGMESMNKEHQANVIYEMSKNSAFFKRAQEQDAKVAAKVSKMKENVARLKQKDLDRMQASASSEMLKLECQRNMTRVCVVFDMDMFYAAVEIRDRPELKDLPVAVGSSQMISTSNYVARKYGVRAAMPGFIGKKLCPNLVFVPYNFEKYRAVGEIIRAIAREYDPKYRSFSLDEVYMDITAYCEDRLKLQLSREEGVNPVSDTIISSVQDLRRVAVTVVEELRSRISSATNGLTCSAGIAHNFLCAKICADVNKPNGQYSLTAERGAFLEWFHALPIRKIPGIGKVMERLLHGLDVTIVAHIHQQSGRIYHLFPGATGRWLLVSSLGIDSYERSFSGTVSGIDSDISSGGFVPGGEKSEAQTQRKSISVSRTFRNINTSHEAAAKLNELCGKLSSDMLAAGRSATTGFSSTDGSVDEAGSGSVDKTEGLAGKCVTVSIKNSKFQCFSKCVTVAGSVYLQSQAELFDNAWPLLSSMLPASLRLIGVSVSKFKGELRQDRAAAGTQALDKFFGKAAAATVSSMPSPGGEDAATLDSPGKNGVDSSNRVSSSNNNGNNSCCWNSGCQGYGDACDEALDHSIHTDTHCFDMQVISQGSTDGHSGDGDGGGGCMGEDLNGGPEAELLSPARGEEEEEDMDELLGYLPPDKISYGPIVESSLEGMTPEPVEKTSRKRVLSLNDVDFSPAVGHSDGSNHHDNCDDNSNNSSHRMGHIVCDNSSRLATPVTSSITTTINQGITTQISCPVCNKLMSSDSYSNAAVNLHIDLCLSNASKLLPNYFRKCK